MRRTSDWPVILKHTWHWPTVVGATILLLVFIVAVQWQLDAGSRSGTPVQAHITWISKGGSRFAPSRSIRIEARTPEGAVGIAQVLPSKIEGCRIGDPIDATQQGIKLYLDPSPC